MHLTQDAPCARQISAARLCVAGPLNNHLFGNFGSWLEQTAPLSPVGRHTKPAEQQELETYFASLGNGVLHDASHIGNGEVDVLLPEVLFNAAVVVVVQTLVCVVCTEKGGREKRRRAERTDCELVTRVDFFAFPGLGQIMSQLICRSITCLQLILILPHADNQAMTNNKIKSPPPQRERESRTNVNPCARLKIST